MRSATGRGPPCFPDTEEGEAGATSPRRGEHGRPRPSDLAQCEIFTSSGSSRMRAAWKRRTVTIVDRPNAIPSR